MSQQPTTAPRAPSASGGQPPPCSVLGERLGESAFGSAADAVAWVALEQSGPWGRAVATDSHLDPVLGAEVDRALAGVGARFALVRRPGPHPDDVAHRAARTLLVACARPGADWLLRCTLTDPRALRALDVSALAAGDRTAVAGSLRGTPGVLDVEPHAHPVLLVCTNGRRDVCCAVRGRPVALGAATARPGRVWETSHTGGHRFAPTAVLLPSGATVARLDVDLAVSALDAATDGRVPVALHGPTHDRGLSALPAPARAAVCAVRATTGEERLDALTAGEPRRQTGSDEGTWAVLVSHRDGRTWQVRARRTVLGPDRPESCGKRPVPQLGWSVDL